MVNKACRYSRIVRLVRVDDAVGLMLGYDTTYVGRDGTTVLLPRGHVITREDVEKLKDSGVYFVWVMGDEEGSDLMYEWEIAETVANAVAGRNVQVKPARQGSAQLVAAVGGVLVVDPNGLRALNLSGNVLLITRQNYVGVVGGDVVGVVDVIPLSMKRQEVRNYIGLGAWSMLSRLERLGLVLLLRAPRFTKAGRATCTTQS